MRLRPCHDDAPPTADPAAAATAAAASSARAARRAVEAVRGGVGVVLVGDADTEQLELAPVCLDPTMSSLSKPRLSKAMKAVESVCPFTATPSAASRPTLSPTRRSSSTPTCSTRGCGSAADGGPAAPREGVPRPRRRAVLQGALQPALALPTACARPGEAYPTSSTVLPGQKVLPGTALAPAAHLVALRAHPRQPAPPADIARRRRGRLPCMTGRERYGTTVSSSPASSWGAASVCAAILALRERAERNDLQGCAGTLFIHTTLVERGKFRREQLGVGAAPFVCRVCPLNNTLLL